MEETKEEPVPTPATDDLKAGQKEHRAFRTKEEKLELAVQIRAYRLQGLPFRDIGKQLNIPHQTAWRIYKESAVEFVKTNLKEQNSLLSDFYSRVEFTWRAHYSKYIESIPKDSDGKPKPGAFGDVSHLQAACKLQMDAFDRLQSAGFIPKVKEKIDLSGSVALKAWFAQFWDNPPTEKQKKEE